MRQRVWLKYLSQSGHWPSGNPRFYYRPPKGKRVAMPDLPSTDTSFIEFYNKIAKGPSEPTFRTGTIGAAVVAYLRCDAFLALSPATRSKRRRALDDIRQRYGEARLADLQPRHIRKDLSPLKPHPANTRLKAWRGFANWCVDAGLIDANPAQAVRRKKTSPARGAAPWSVDDVATFRAAWPLSSPQRLAFELMYRTAASIGDACKLGPGMVGKDGWLTYERGKSGSVATCLLTADAPAWSEPDDFLRQSIAAQPARHLTFIVTAHGKPRSTKAAAAWFSAACRKAGLIDRTAHGIRKHRASRFRELGASLEQRMAWLGHESESVAVGYSRAADLREIIAGGGAGPGTKSSNSPDQVPTPRQTRQ